MTYKATPEEFI